MLTYMETVERVKNGTPLKCVGCAHRKHGLCCYAADTGELRAKIQSEAKEVRQAEQQPADWMAETATMIQGVALLYGIDVGDLIRDALKVWMQKQAEG